MTQELWTPVPVQESYWRQWLQPPTVIAIVVASVTMYGGWVLQSERMDALRAKVDNIERDYQRRDVQAEQLRSIDSRLYAIELKLGQQQQQQRQQERR